MWTTSPSDTLPMRMTQGLNRKNKQTHTHTQRSQLCLLTQMYTRGSFSYKMKIKNVCVSHHLTPLVDRVTSHLIYSVDCANI